MISASYSSSSTNMSIQIELDEYDAEIITPPLKLFIVPVIMDPDFIVEGSKQWSVDERKTLPRFASCRQDPGLSLFTVCGGLRESFFQVIELDPRDPFKNHTLRIFAREGMKGFDPVSIPIKISRRLVN